MKKYISIVISITLLFTIFMATACSSNEELNGVAGEYQAVEFDNGNDDDYIGGYWHLYIGQDEESGDWNFSIYDNEAGNPGVEGPITEMDEESFTVKYDPDFFDQLPSSHWNMDGDYLKVEFELTADGIELSNNGKTITFVRDGGDEEE